MVWHENQVRYKDDTVVIKLRNDYGNFKKSVIVPTAYYPLNGKYKAFHYQNTKQVTDENVLRVFDEVKYRIGHCYTNTEELVFRLKENDYNAKSYVGWLFTSNTEYPIHHCWCVLDDDSILDLSDDYTAMLSGGNHENFKNKSIEETRELIADFQQAARKVKNSIRCCPVGTPTPFFLYVGCECDPEVGKTMYQNLIARFPNHECQRNCDSSGMNATQKVMKEKGLM